ncbi:MAG: tetratricopeptide repeat protein [Planctomycetota bacterium]|jgi:Flp pilus assembly protein TadD|nr:tetratricopeptide repeat protein [Planctomycetota bacterium]
MVMQKPDAVQLAGIRFQIGVAEEALSAQPNDTDILRYLAHAYTLVERAEEGLLADQRLVKLMPTDARVHYNLACSYALTGKKDEALETLQEARDLGFEDLELLRNDEDLEILRTDPRFKELERRLAEGREED